MTHPRDTGTEEQGAGRLGEILDLVKREADRLLASGQQPEADPWIERYPDAAAEIEAVIEMRIVASEVGGEDSPGDTERESVLAEIRARIQDAANRNEAADFEALVARYPAHEEDIERLAQDVTQVEDALLGEGMVAFAQDDEPFRESVLGTYRLRRLVDNHPLGPIYLAEPETGGAQVELLILRPFREEADRRDLIERAHATQDLKTRNVSGLLSSGVSAGIHFLVFSHAGGISLGHALEVVFESRGEVGLDDILKVRRELSDEARTLGEDVWRSGSHREIAQRLARNQEHLGAVVTVMSHVAHAVSSAHSQGILHQGLSPRAVMVASGSRIALRWFGISGHLERRFKDGNPLMRYLAPEMVLGGSDRRTWSVDVYGLGALMHTVLRLEPPHLGFRGLDDWKQQIARSPPSLAEDLAVLPRALVDLVDRCLARDPRQRPATCAEVAEVLDGILARDLRPSEGWLKRGLRGIFRRG